MIYIISVEAVELEGSCKHFSSIPSIIDYFVKIENDKGQKISFDMNCSDYPSFGMIINRYNETK